MRSAPLPWFHARATVPLTGRQPVLGRLETRLAGRGPGWGVVLLRGPRGGGTSRLLDEIGSTAADDGSPRVLRVESALPEDAALEALRRALERLLGATPRSATERALRAALPGRSTDVLRGLAWVYDGPEAGAGAPDSDTIRAVLAALVPAGPILVDDLSRLDLASRALLLAEGDGRGPGLLAGVSAEGAVADAEAEWTLDPLGRAQCELLLRRWLRHPVTVRRLLPPLAALTGGWPGRLVRAVRLLARRGGLVQGRRGVEIRAGSMPDGFETDEPESFERFLESVAPAERTTLEAAALLDAVPDEELLSRAAHVKLHVVEDLRAEVAVRWPDAQGRLFPSGAIRRRVRDALPAEDRRRLGRDWLAAWQGRADRGIRDLSARLQAALEAEDAQAAAEGLGEIERRLAPLGPAASLVGLLTRARSCAAGAPGRATARPVAASSGGRRVRRAQEVPSDPAGRVTTSPASRLLEARARLLAGDPTALVLLARVGEDERAPLDVRVEALARWAYALLRGGDASGARRAAEQAAHLLELARGPRPRARAQRVLRLTLGVLQSEGRESSPRV